MSDDDDVTYVKGTPTPHGLKVEVVYTRDQLVELLTDEGFDRAGVLAELESFPAGRMFTAAEAAKLRWVLLP